ncbi:hypothetical protein J2X69_000582 [Algoriphagus sp. 4150]|uniref:hypothetical protein n=1 Tax=Algoriphagus sp. 4150 TaxID=2817756 RepID=UPI002862A547|nr:hypothetical protein [Algoriphagus sp. 4150]MDR7128254.1 hypothetical protein [Algoriphagus sp. 4150]
MKLSVAQNLTMIPFPIRTLGFETKDGNQLYKQLAGSFPTTQFGSSNTTVSY